MIIVRKIINLVVFACVALLVGCEGTRGTGSAVVEVVFQAPADDASLRGVLTGVVDSVRVEVRDDVGALVQKAFSYDDLQGTVDGIPAGTGRNFLVEALDGEVVVYRGTALDVTIVADQTVNVPVVLSSAYQEDIYAPASVGDLSAQGQGADVVLSWTATGDDGLVGRAGSYDLRWSLSTIQSSNFDAATSIPDTPVPAVAGERETFTVTGLTPDTTYHFALRVVDNDGNRSGLSNEAIVTIGASDDTPPDTIDDLSVESFDATSVTLAWTAPGDDGSQGTVAQYDVRYSTSEINDDNFDQAQSAQGPSSLVAAGQSQTLVVAGLTEGQQYYFAMKAADEVPNWSGLSNVVAATPADVTAPDAVALTVQSVDDTSVTLEWVAPGDDGSVGTAQSYEIRYSTDAIDSGSFSDATLWDSPPAPQEAGTVQSVSITPLQTGVQYSFAMICYDDAGNASALSNVVLATPGEQDDVPPSDVSDLTVQSVADTSVVLTWTAPGDDGGGGNPVSAYDVRYASTAIDDVSFDAATQFVWPGGTDIVAAGQTQTLELTGLEREQTYFFALKARDEFSNWSGVSNSPSATTVDTTSPSDIVDLQVTAFGDDFITVAWTAPGDDGSTGTASAYEIYYSSSAFDDYTVATSWANVPNPQLAGTQQSVTIDGLTPGSEVFVRIRASDEVPNWSGLSNQVSQVLSCSSCPLITAVRPPVAPVGSVVYIDGMNFGSTQDTSIVTFAGVDTTVVSWSDSRLKIKVPAIAGGVDAEVLLTTSTGAASSSFTVAPFIDSLTPESLSPPGIVLVNGSGFGDSQGTSSVQIVGSVVQPSVTSWTDTGISLDIPANIRTGPVKITVGSNSSNTPLLTIDPRSWTSPAYVVDDTNPSHTPRLSADSQDYLQLLWIETDGVSSNMQVFAKERGENGWNSNALNLSASAVNSASPVLVNMGPSQFLAAWLDGDALSSSLGFGASFSSVYAVDAGPDRGPCLVALTGGQALAVWAAQDGLSLRYSIRDGSGVWSSSAEAFVTAGNSSSVACAVDGAGFVHVAFADGANLDHSMFDGVQWSSPEVTNPLTGEPSLVKPAMAIGPKGQINLIWWDNGAYYVAANKGAIWSNAVAISSVSSSTAARPAVIMDSAGSLLLAVEDDQGTERAVVFLKKLPDDTWSVPVEISIPNDSSDAFSPDLTEGGLMDLHLVWSEGDRIYISSLQ